MAETATTKKYLSLEGLQNYDDLIKEEITSANTTTLSSAKSYSDTNLSTAKSYTDNAVAQKSQVQIITWGADD